ncbi:ABC transporter permease [Celeribacter sp. SCSIO 80788]|uniref:ABC transporter permease n=1 Tax=Celeribacter sp. SCSIO 80788 TaxID=3117013 RepID=UPI003DA407E0
MNFFDSFLTNLPKLLDGVQTTLLLTGLGALIAAAASPGLALLRANGPRPAQLALKAYISFMRGTPLLAQLFLVFYGSGQFRAELTALGLWGFFRDPFNCAVLVFAVNSCAYQTEILRGGIQGVSPGEIEAARAIGMSRPKILRRVTFPHAYRIAWPALGNEIILLMKASALASIVTVFDLMGRTRQIFSRSFELSVYFQAAILYLIITACFVTLWRLAEHRLLRHMTAPRRS